MLLRAAAIAVVVFVVGPTAAGCPGRLSPGNACRSVQLAQCHFAFQCCTGAERQQFAGSIGVGAQFATEADCLDLGAQIRRVSA